MNRLNCHSSHLAALAIPTGRGLAIVGHVRPTNFGAIQLGPQKPPVIGAKIFAADLAVSSQLETDAVFGTRRTISVPVLPLAQLGITLDVIAKRAHPKPKLGHGQRARQREVLVESHSLESVANDPRVAALATLYKYRLLCVARATLRV